jgi:flagellar biogenesis protein FliO
MMMDAAWRLAWALPLVLLVGAAAVLLLRRFVLPTQPATLQRQRLSRRESLSLSQETRVHLIEVDGKPYLLVESARQALLQSTSSPTAEPSRPSAGFGPSWARRLFRAGPR